MIEKTPKTVKQALSSTGGFLTGFTHTLNPYTGCAFGCEYCYVKALPVHVFHKPKIPWGEYIHPKVNIAERLRTELIKYKNKQELSSIKIFMSSATDPYQGMERTEKLTQQCLQVIERLTPKLLVIQTRSLLVERDFDIILSILERHKKESNIWLNMTIETDLDEVRKIITPKCPSIVRRAEVVRKATQLGIPTQITVSPCLPYSNPDSFAQFLVDIEPTRILIDTFVSGDGTNPKYKPGQRTSRTKISDIYEAKQYDDWKSEDSPRELYYTLQKYFTGEIGWSSDGFVELTKEK